MMFDPVAGVMYGPSLGLDLGVLVRLSSDGMGVPLARLYAGV